LDAQLGTIETNQKTRIKRPKNLQLIRQGKLKLTDVTHSFRNKFGAVSDLFFYPIQQSLHYCYLSLQQKSSKILLPTNTAAETDEFDAMLPTQCLLTLGSMVRCSIHTPSQRKYALQVYNMATIVKFSSSLSLRRASYATHEACFESFLVLKSSWYEHPRSREENGLLQSLLTITDSETGFENSFSDLDISKCAIETMEWMTPSLNEELDSTCRILKISTLQKALDILDIEEDQKE
jgi:hypothetical protein